jgi:predicted phosphodiesterase
MIGIVSDTHGNLAALEAIIEDLDRRGVTDVVNLGDHVSGPLWPRETAELLMQQSWIQISGNHDRQVSRDNPATHGAADAFAFRELTATQRDWLATLPATASHPAGIQLCHGTPASDNDFLLEEIACERMRLMRADEMERRLGRTSAGVFCCGHSHLPRTVQVGRTVVINPGSVGLQAFIDPAYRAETGAPHARYAILTRRDQAWTVQHLAIEYDWERAARRAADLGEPAWAHALRTGFSLISPPNA